MSGRGVGREAAEGGAEAGGVVYRAGEARDLGGIVALTAGVANAPHWNEAVYAAILGAAGGIPRGLVVAEVDGEVAGLVVVSVVRDVAEVENLVVREEMRRRGLGMGLCRAGMAWCRERGATSLVLEARQSNAAALALYQRMGFVAVGTRAGYYTNPAEDAVLMSLELSAVA